MGYIVFSIGNRYLDMDRGVNVVASGGMSRILEHINSRNFGIVTAYLGEEDLREWNNRLESAGGRGSSNKERNDDLRRRILVLGYGFIRLEGHWVTERGDNKEVSFFVVGGEFGKDSKRFLGDMVDLCLKYQQEAVFVSAAGAGGERVSGYYDRDGNLGKRFGDVHIKSDKDIKDLVEGYLKDLEEGRENEGGVGYSRKGNVNFQFDRIEVKAGRMGFIFDDIRAYLDFEGEFDRSSKGRHLFKEGIKLRRELGYWVVGMGDKVFDLKRGER